ncbi:MAG: HU family DNA-binding protein [Gammaproteobacteria bacterium]|nr:HU family DNA-binding protein [Gammaproteobacteria bacterium]
MMDSNVTDEITLPAAEMLARICNLPSSPAISTKQNRIQVIATLAAMCNLRTKEVEALFSGLNELIHGHMRTGGSGEFTIPDIGVKIKRVAKPAKPERIGHNPATGQAIVVPAKPECQTVKLVCLKKLKESV